MSETPKCATCGEDALHAIHDHCGPEAYRLTYGGRHVHPFAAPVSEAAPTPETCGGRCYGEDGRQPLGRRCVLDKGHAGECDNRVPTTPLAPAGEPRIVEMSPETRAMWEEREGWKRTASDRGFEVTALRARVASLTTERDARLLPTWRDFDLCHSGAAQFDQQAFAEARAYPRNPQWAANSRDAAEGLRDLARRIRPLIGERTPSPESPL